MTAVYKNNPNKIWTNLFLDDLCGYLGPRNYVSMRKRETCLQSLPRGNLNPSKCALRSFGAMQRVPRFLMET